MIFFLQCKLEQHQDILTILTKFIMLQTQYSNEENERENNLSV